MDLIRSVMLQLEARLEPEVPLTEFPMEAIDAAVVLEHLILLQEAGFIALTVERYGGGAPAFFVIHRITWAGHEFLEAVRSDTVWEKSKKVLLSTGVGLAWPLLQAVLRAKAAEHLGIAL